MLWLYRARVLLLTPFKRKKHVICLLSSLLEGWSFKCPSWFLMNYFYGLSFISFDFTLISFYIFFLVSSLVFFFLVSHPFFGYKHSLTLSQGTKLISKQWVSTVPIAATGVLTKRDLFKGLITFITVEGIIFVIAPVK